MMLVQPDEENRHQQPMILFEIKRKSCSAKKSGDVAMGPSGLTGACSSLQIVSCQHCESVRAVGGLRQPLSCGKVVQSGYVCVSGRPLDVANLG